MDSVLVNFKHFCPFPIFSELGRWLAGLNLKKEASVPLSRIKDLRFGTQGSPYRTSLQISKEVEPRWITVIYTVSSSSRQVLNSAGNYKLVHFIAPTVELVELWKTTLERFKEGRMARGVGGGDLFHEELEVPVEEQTRVVKEAEVHQLCARLGVGMGRTEVSAAFRVSSSLCSPTSANLSTDRKRQHLATTSTFPLSKTLSSFSRDEKK